MSNAGDGEGGRTFSLVTGTWNSVNTFFLNLEKQVGLCETVKMAEKLGMRRADGKPLEQVASFTLGPNTVSPVRLAAAYAAFGARGKYCDPVVMTKVTDTNGHALKVPDAKCHQAVRKGVADAVNHVLRGVLTQGTAAGMGIGRQAAGKTGTVDDFTSAWFAGYTPDMASAVWVGDPRGGYAHPLRNVCLGGRCYGEVFGADIPAPIWRETMLNALRDVPAHGFHDPPGDYYREGSGEDRIQVPDVTGLSAPAARARLGAAGLGVSTGTSIPSPAPKGTVVSQSPGGGAAVEPGTTVTIYLSKGLPHDQGPPPPGGGGGRRRRRRPRRRRWRRRRRRSDDSAAHVPADRRPARHHADHPPARLTSRRRSGPLTPATSPLRMPLPTPVRRLPPRAGGGSSGVRHLPGG